MKTRGLRRGRAAPQGELDELEREEFFRLKKVQSNKKKHAEAAASQEARLVSCLPAACGARRSASPLAVPETACCACGCVAAHPAPCGPHSQEKPQAPRLEVLRGAGASLNTQHDEDLIF